GIVGLEAAAERAPATRGRPEATEHLADDVFEMTGTGSGPGLKAFRTEREGLEVGVAAARACATATAAPEALEALETRLALGVDLAGIISLALLLFAQDLVGRVDLGEPLRGLRVVLVGVGMKLLRKLAEGPLDGRGVRILRNPQHFIGVAHNLSLRSLR